MSEDAQKEIIDPSRQFYVTCWNGVHGEGFKAIALLGPFETHGEALDNVSVGRSLVEQISDPSAHWYAFGTASALRDGGELQTAFRKEGDETYSYLDHNGVVVLKGLKP